MARVYEVRHHDDNRLLGYAFECPACGHSHCFWIVQWQPEGNRVWSFNGNVDLPTFSPSLLIHHSEEPGEPLQLRCHSRVRDGLVEYLLESEHHLKGRVVPLPDLEVPV